MNKMCLYLLLLIPFSFACNKESLKSVEFTDLHINLKDKEDLVYSFSECEFDNRLSNAQFNFSSGSVGKEISSSYFNRIDTDSTINRFSPDLLFIESEKFPDFTASNIENILSDETSSMNNESFQLLMSIYTCGKVYNNRTIDDNPLTPRYIGNSEFSFEILDFEVLFDSDCIANDLLYLKLRLGGKLFYYYNLETEPRDSIEMLPAEYDLLFDIGR